MSFNAQYDIQILVQEIVRFAKANVVESQEAGNKITEYNSRYQATCKFTCVEYFGATSIILHLLTSITRMRNLR